MGRIERPSDQHSPPHSKAPGQLPLSPREPPREPLQHPRVTQSSLPAPDVEPHPTDRRSEHGRFGHDECHWRRQPIARHADLRHDGIFRERRFHLGGGHLRAARQHERVDEPAGDPYVAVGIDRGQVAGLEPFRLDPSGMRRLCVRVISNHADRAAGRSHEQLATRGGSGVERQFHAIDRRPDGAGPRDPGIGERDHRTGLGEAIPLHQRETAG